MRSSSQITPPRGAGIVAAGLSLLALVLSPATPARAQGVKAGADAEFLTTVVPSIAASVKIIDYEVKYTSDAAFLEWLSHIHHDTTLFDNEVKNGSDPALKSYAKGSITAGNGHLDEAQELLARLKRQVGRSVSRMSPGLGRTPGDNTLTTRQRVARQS